MSPPHAAKALRAAGFHQSVDVGQARSFFEEHAPGTRGIVVDGTCLACWVVHSHGLRCVGPLVPRSTAEAIADATLTYATTMAERLLGQGRHVVVVAYDHAVPHPMKAATSAQRREAQRGRGGLDLGELLVQAKDQRWREAVGALEDEFFPLTPAAKASIASAAAARAGELSRRGGADVRVVVAPGEADAELAAQAAAHNLVAVTPDVGDYFSFALADGPICVVSTTGLARTGCVDVYSTALPTNDVHAQRDRRVWTAYGGLGWVCGVLYAGSDHAPGVHDVGFARARERLEALLTKCHTRDAWLRAVLDDIDRLLVRDLAPAASAAVAQNKGATHEEAVALVKAAQARTRDALLYYTCAATTLSARRVRAPIPAFVAAGANLFQKGTDTHGQHVAAQPPWEPAGAEWAALDSVPRELFLRVAPARVLLHVLGCVAEGGDAPEDFRERAAEVMRATAFDRDVCGELLEYARGAGWKHAARMWGAFEEEHASLHEARVPSWGPAVAAAWAFLTHNAVDDAGKICLRVTGNAVVAATSAGPRRRARRKEEDDDEVEEKHTTMPRVVDHSQALVTIARFDVLDRHGRALTLAVGPGYSGLRLRAELDNEIYKTDTRRRRTTAHKTQKDPAGDAGAYLTKALRVFPANRCRDQLRAFFEACPDGDDSKAKQAALSNDNSSTKDTYKFGDVLGLLAGFQFVYNAMLTVLNLVRTRYGDASYVALVKNSRRANATGMYWCSATSKKELNTMAGDAKQVLQHLEADYGLGRNQLAENGSIFNTPPAKLRDMPGRTRQDAYQQVGKSFEQAVLSAKTRARKCDREKVPVLKGMAHPTMPLHAQDVVAYHTPRPWCTVRETKRLVEDPKVQVHKRLGTLVRLAQRLGSRAEFFVRDKLPLENGTLARDAKLRRVGKRVYLDIAVATRERVPPPHRARAVVTVDLGVTPLMTSTRVLEEVVDGVTRLVLDGAIVTLGTNLTPEATHALETELATAKAALVQIVDAIVEGVAGRSELVGVVRGAKAALERADEANKHLVDAMNEYLGELVATAVYSLAKGDAECPTPWKRCLGAKAAVDTAQARLDAVRMANGAGLAVAGARARALTNRAQALQRARACLKHSNPRRAKRLRKLGQAVAAQAAEARRRFSSLARVAARSVVRVLSSQARGGILYVPRASIQGWLRGLHGGAKDKLRDAQLGRVIPALRARAAVMDFTLFLGTESYTTKGCAACCRVTAVPRDADVVTCGTCGVSAHRDAIAALRNLCVKLDPVALGVDVPATMPSIVGVAAPQPRASAPDLHNYVLDWPATWPLADTLTQAERQHLHLARAWEKQRVKVVEKPAEAPSRGRGRGRGMTTTTAKKVAKTSARKKPTKKKSTTTMGKRPATTAKKTTTTTKKTAAGTQDLQSPPGKRHRVAAMEMASAATTKRRQTRAEDQSTAAGKRQRVAAAAAATAATTTTTTRKTAARKTPTAAAQERDERAGKRARRAASQVELGGSDAREDVGDRTVHGR